MVEPLNFFLAEIERKCIMYSIKISQSYLKIEYVYEEGKPHLSPNLVKGKSYLAGSRGFMREK